MKTFGTTQGEKHLRKLMEDPRYWKKRDPNYVAMIQKGFDSLFYGNSEKALAVKGQKANQMGINGLYHAQDSLIGHLTPGEIVIPLNAQTPELMQYLSLTLGKDLLQYIVGSGHEQENPTSGLPAFASCPKLSRLAFRMINATTAVNRGTKKVWLCRTNQETGEKYWEEQDNMIEG